MMPFSNFPQLVQSVQRNCHVADARHAREMTLCNYLLEMREFYRWEHDAAGAKRGIPIRFETPPGPAARTGMRSRCACCARIEATDAACVLPISRASARQAAIGWRTAPVLGLWAIVREETLPRIAPDVVVDGFDVLNRFR